MSSPLAKMSTPIQDFLARVLVFKLHIFSRDSLVAFDSYQFEKVRNTRIFWSLYAATHTILVQCVCFFLLVFFLTQIRKTDVILMKNVDHVFCQIFQLWGFRLVCLWQLIVLFPPARYYFNNSVSLNAFASKAAINAVIVGAPVMI